MPTQESSGIAQANRIAITINGLDQELQAGKTSERSGPQVLSVMRSPQSFALDVFNLKALPDARVAELRGSERRVAGLAQLGRSRLEADPCWHPPFCIHARCLPTLTWLRCYLPRSHTQMVDIMTLLSLGCGRREPCFAGHVG